MSDFIDRVRALDKAATEGPWINGETGVTQDYSHLVRTGENRFSSVGIVPEEHVFPDDAEFIAAARTMLPAAVEALARVRELHRKYGLYELEDSCTNISEEHRQERHHEASDEVGEFYCEDMPVGAVCDECRNEDGERLDWPCETYKAAEVDNDGGV